MASESTKVVTIGGVKAVRRLPSWIDAFNEFTTDIQSPSIFKKWAGICAVSGALERRVWVRTAGKILYPNLYVALVGPPGIGKTVITTEIEHLWRSIDELHVAPSSLSKASMVDALEGAKRRIVRPGQQPPIVEYHVMLICSPELSDLIPTYDPLFMSFMQSMYDPLPQYQDQKRSKSINITLVNPQVTMLAGTTPSFLNTLMPEGAWDQGFISRTFLIYSGEQNTRSLFQESPRRTGLEADLKNDLRILAADETYGLLTWEPEAAQLMDRWHMSGGEPRPNELKLQHYVTRRTGHLLKLCMVSAMDRYPNNMEITVGDFQRALGWLTEAEHYMDDIFKSMTVGADGKAIEETWAFLYGIWIKEKKIIPEHRMMAFMASRLPAHSVLRVRDIMIQSRWIEQVVENGRAYYKPLPKPEY